MKTLAFYGLIALLALTAKAQTNHSQFANQGQQEDNWAIQLFKDKYVKQSFDKFKGKISVINAQNIRFDTTVLQIDIVNKDLQEIFTTGLIYPDIISGNLDIGGHIGVGKGGIKQRDTAGIKRPQQYSIAAFEELSFLSNSPRVKRFRFWLYNKFVTNPEVCFIELTNDNATQSTPLSTFINGSKLTFFIHGWTII